MAGWREWGSFSHLPGKRFTDFSAIREEIQVSPEPMQVGPDDVVYVQNTSTI